MKSITVYAYRHDETPADCTVKFSRAAYYKSGKKKAKVTTNPAAQAFATPITLRIKASPSVTGCYSTRDYCDLAESAIEAKI